MGLKNIEKAQVLRLGDEVESLRQRDRGAKTIFRRAPFVPTLNQMFLPELLIFVSATSFLFF